MLRAHTACRLLVWVMPLLTASAGLTALDAASREVPSAALGTKLDPALLSFALSTGDSATVWVCFGDKSPGGPVEEARALAGVRASLTARALARRQRARVSPLVDAADLPVAPAYLDALRAQGLAPFAVSRWLNRAAVRVAPGSLEALARLPFVAAIAPVRRARLEPARPPGGEVVRSGPEPWLPASASRSGLSSPPVPSTLSGLSIKQLDQIGATGLHDSSYVGTGELIAVLDEGFNFHDKHEALRNLVIAPGFARDFVDGDTTVTDTTQLSAFEHGTWTLGCLAGYEPGVYLGSAYGADYALARSEVEATETPVEMLYWAQAAEWADSLGADVISSSVGYLRFDDPASNFAASDLDGHTAEISRAAEIAASKGILVVNSVGNDGEGPLPRLVAPADVNGDSLLAIGAVDSFGTVSVFSSRGPTADGRIKPDLVARGEAAWLISASGNPNAYFQFDGTSFSAPLVAGLAACVLQVRPTWTATEVIRALRETATNCCGPDNASGWGTPRGVAAIAWTPGPPAPALPPAGYLELALQSPNPVEPRQAPLEVRFGLGPRFGEDQHGRLRVFDATGRLVRDLFSGPLACGRWHVVQWSGDDRDGAPASSGVYFVNLYVAGRTSTVRFALLR